VRQADPGKFVNPRHMCCGVPGGFEVLHACGVREVRSLVGCLLADGLGLACVSVMCLADVGRVFGI
jgi:hypothetical protein